MEDGGCGGGVSNVELMSGCGQAPRKIPCSVRQVSESKDYGRLPEALKRFYVVQACDEARMTALCTLCETTVKSNVGVTSNLHRHLKMRHLEEVQEYFSWSVIPYAAACKQSSTSPSCATVVEPTKENTRLSIVLQRYYAMTNIGENRMTLTCRLCGALVKSNIGVTSNFHRHLKIKHSQEILTEIAPMESLNNCEKTNSNASAYPDNLKQEILIQSLLELVVSDISLLSNVDGDGFRKFVNTLASNFKMCSRAEILQRLQQSVQQEVLPTFRKLINDVPNGCLHSTINLWTSPNQSSIICVTFHLISKEWDLVHNTIALLHSEEERPFGNIFKKFESVLFAFELGIDKVNIAPELQVGYLVPGDAKGMLQCSHFWNVDYGDDDMDQFMSEMTIEMAIGMNRTAEKELIGASEPIIFPIVHQLHMTVMETICSFIGIADLFATIGYVQQFFLKCPKWNAKLESSIGQPLFETCQFRWISQMDILKRLSQEETFVTICRLLQEAESDGSCEIDPPSLASQTLTEMAELVEILTPVVEASVVLQQANCVTSSLVIPALKDMYSGLQSVQCTVASFKNALLLNISGVCMKIVSDKVFVMATLLDQRFKLRPFLDNVEMPGLPNALAAEQVLSTEYSLIEDSATAEDSDDGRSAKNLNKRRRMVTSECDRYLNENDDNSDSESSSKSDDPLEYWKSNCGHYPKLARLARKYLSVPVTTAAAERLFTVTKDICRSRRAQITPLELETVVLYRDNCMHS